MPRPVPVISWGYEQAHPPEPQCRDPALPPGLSTKYRRAVFSDKVNTALRDICLEIAARHDIAFLEIGTDQNLAHVLVQTIPACSPSIPAQIIKSLTDREVFRRVPGVKEFLWGDEFWSDGTYGI
jgi:putative transposase